MMKWYILWRAKREIRRSAKLIKKFVETMPSSAFENLIQKGDGTFMTRVEAINHLWLMADRMEKGKYDKETIPSS